MFRHVLALNTYTEPFLSLKANEQRTIIEQLLGITLLSERADRIKELNKVTKDGIAQELGQIISSPAAIGGIVNKVGGIAGSIFPKNIPSGDSIIASAKKFFG
jgi:hypothetical protein